jgi:hypothetical protein
MFKVRSTTKPIIRTFAIVPIPIGSFKRERKNKIITPTKIIVVPILNGVRLETP